MSKAKSKSIEVSFAKADQDKEDYEKNNHTLSPMILAPFYKNEDINNSFLQQINKLNMSFSDHSDSYLNLKAEIDKVSDSLFINLFKQVSIYVEEIERLNLLLIEQQGDVTPIIKLTNPRNKEIAKYINIIKGLEQKLFDKTENEEKMHKEIQSYKRQLTFFQEKMQLFYLDNPSKNSKRVAMNNHHTTNKTDAYQKISNYKKTQNQNTILIGFEGSKKKNIEIITPADANDHGQTKIIGASLSTNISCHSGESKASSIKEIKEKEDKLDNKKDSEKEKETEPKSPSKKDREIEPKSPSKKNRDKGKEKDKDIEKDKENKTKKDKTKDDEVEMINKSMELFGKEDLFIDKKNYASLAKEYHQMMSQEIDLLRQEEKLLQNLMGHLVQDPLLQGKS